MDTDKSTKHTEWASLLVRKCFDPSGYDVVPWNQRHKAADPAIPGLSDLYNLSVIP
jgi:hypothetical protein